MNFVKELIGNFKEGSAMDKLGIISSAFTIVGVSLVATLTSYFVDQYKVNMLGIFFINCATNLSYILLFLLFTGIYLKFKKYFIKLFGDFGNAIFVVLYLAIMLLFIGVLLRFGKDISFIFRK